jgi:nucleoside phosphorylase
MDSTECNTLTHSDYKVGLLCSLPKEQTAITAMLDQIHTRLPVPSYDRNTYTLGSMGGHNVVIAWRVFGRALAETTTRMVSAFPTIKFFLLVGIGSGMPFHVSLGDVVVSAQTTQSSRLVKLDLQQFLKYPFVESAVPVSPNQMSSTLMSALVKLETQEELTGSMIPEYLKEMGERLPRLAAKYSRAPRQDDLLFKSHYVHVDENGTQDGSALDGVVGPTQLGESVVCRLCDRSELEQKTRQDLRVHYGLIVSSDQIIRDANIRDMIQKSLRPLGRVYCLEIEAADWNGDFPGIVIRGISDYADTHKNSDWQEYAAATAAAFAKEFLSAIHTEEVAQIPSKSHIYSDPQ